MSMMPVAKPGQGARHATGALLVRALLACALLGGCAGLVPQTMALRDGWPEGVARRVDIADVPFFAQLDNQCGPAALATVLVGSGVDTTPEKLAGYVFLPARQGSLQADMLAAPRRLGRVSWQLAPRFDDLLREVAAGNPVIVLQDLGVGPFASWHYAVVVGYDYEAGELYLRSGETRRKAVPFTLFEYSWKQGGYWAMVAVPPARIPASATESGYLAAVAALDRVADPAPSTAAWRAFDGRWPGNAGASIGLANRHYAAGDLGAAEAVLRQAAGREPVSTPVLNNLAQVLSDLGRDDEALAVISRAGMAAEGRFAAEVRQTRALVEQRIATRHIPRSPRP
jgi:hypothetical protein